MSRRSAEQNTRGIYDRPGLAYSGLGYGDYLRRGLSLVGEGVRLQGAKIHVRMEADAMTPNDLYSECLPVKQKRKPRESMFFPLRPFRPDRFLAIPLATQFKSGNSHMLSNARAKALLKRLGL